MMAMEKKMSINGNGNSLVLVAGLGRGGDGKSTLLAEMVWRARNEGREVLVMDADLRSRTLGGMFSDAMRPDSEEMLDVKTALSKLLNRMVREQKSAVLDLGGGDRALLEFGRDLRLIEFCEKKGIEALALNCLGPEEESLSHVYTIFSAGYFRPRRSLLVLNEGVIRAGQNVVGAFTRTLADSRYAEMLAAGAQPMMLRRLACMETAKAHPGGFYAAASGEGGLLDPVEEFMTSDWIADIADKRMKVGAQEWMP